MRPPLRPIPLASVRIGPGTKMLTINPGCWDLLTRAAYEDGWILLEVENEIPVRAFQRETGKQGNGCMHPPPPRRDLTFANQEEKKS